MDVKNDDHKSLVIRLQDSLDYMEEKLLVYEEMLQAQTGHKKPILSNNHKRRLAQAGEKLSQYILSQVEKTFSPDTIREWYRKLIGSKYNGTDRKQRKPGSSKISETTVELVVHMATSNPHWGCQRIASYMNYIGYEISFMTVRRILVNHGFNPDPEKNSKGNWKWFIDTHQHIMASCDFAVTEILTPQGLTRNHILFFENISTREVHLGGICRDPDGPWIEQVARNMCDMWDGKLLGLEFLIHDRDPLFTQEFEKIMASVGINCKKLPPRSPELNGHIESFIKTFRVECMNHLILTSEEQLRYVVMQWLEYYNRERPHSALGGKMINPWPQDPDGEVQEFSRLGGLLKSYRRVKRAG